MARASQMPPPLSLANARVLEYAVLAEDVSYSGHSSLFVDGKELGPVPCLAICQTSTKDEIHLLHCDRSWTILGTVGYSSVAQAKKRAERIYPGVSSYWVKMPATRQDAGESAGKPAEDLRCSFCGKRPNEVNQMIARSHTRICNFCIGEFHRTLRGDS